MCCKEREKDKERERERKREREREREREGGRERERTNYQDSSERSSNVRARESDWGLTVSVRDSEGKLSVSEGVRANCQCQR